MAYMTNQWLKSLSKTHRFHYPVSVDIKSFYLLEGTDWKRELWEEENDITYTLELEKKEDVGYGSGEPLIEETHQRIYLTQADVELLIWNLLKKTSRDMSNEAKRILIALLADTSEDE